MDEYSGFLRINKPKGISSFKIIPVLRKITNIKKIGHAGTLDPFASGLLIVAIGRQFTKQIEAFQLLNKTYRAVMVLGIETDTLDSYGKITKKEGVNNTEPFTKQNITSILRSFVGVLDQVPPQFSAKSVNGVRAYKKARAGQNIELKPSRIQIFDINLDNVEILGPYPKICFTVHCSKGTYIRALVRDIAKKIGYCSYTKDLERVKIGTHNIATAVQFGDLSIDTIKNNIFTKME